MSVPERYDRNVRLFGIEGQRKLFGTRVAVIGVGGLGSALVQQLALLGVGRLSLVDDEELDETNRNRFIGARHDDPVPGTPKVRIVKRAVGEINPAIEVVPVKAELVSAEAFAAVRSADWVFGCFDSDGPRAILTELCAAYEKPYIDLASDVLPDGSFGGRVCTAWNNEGCLDCLGELDHDDVRRYLSNDEEREVDAAVYGVPREALGTTGPSVAPVNGVIASIAATQFMAAVTGIAKPRSLINWAGHVPRITMGERSDDYCYYCHDVRGRGADANVERYLQVAHLLSNG